MIAHGVCTRLPPFQHKYSRLAQPSPGVRRYERTGLGGSEASFRGCQLMPRARKYECEACGERAVYGAEELLLMVTA